MSATILVFYYYCRKLPQMYQLKMIQIYHLSSVHQKFILAQLVSLSWISQSSDQVSGWLLSDKKGSEGGSGKNLLPVLFRLLVESSSLEL